jgi:uncharacterized protein (TIGR04255 family)
MTVASEQRWETFRSAPITEALLDIRVRNREGLEFDRLAPLHDEIKDAYPQKRERYRFQGEVRIEKGQPPTMSEARSGPDGFLFTSLDGRRIVQARVDGFTFNWLKPYDRWDTFRDEARMNWERYRKLACPESVTRVALRYINRIPLPLPLRDFKDYVLTVPEVASDLPQGLVGFLMRLVLPFPQHECLVIVTETIEEAVGERLPWILDIDAYVERGWSPENPEIWDVFERLRDVKNEVFFKSLTERTKELFR